MKNKSDATLKGKHMDFEKEYNREFQDYRDMDIFEEMKEFCAQKLAQQKAILTAEIEGMKKELEPETREMEISMKIGEYMEIVKRNNKKRQYNLALDDVLKKIQDL